MVHRGWFVNIMAMVHTMFPSWSIMSYEERGAALQIAKQCYAEEYERRLKAHPDMLAKRKKKQKERYLRTSCDPEWRATHLRKSREYYRRMMADPERRAIKIDNARRWRATHPEEARECVRRYRARHSAVSGK